jgi:hypothetical protein
MTSGLSRKDHVYVSSPRPVFHSNPFVRFQHCLDVVHRVRSVAYRLSFTPIFLERRLVPSSFHDHVSSFFTHHLQSEAKFSCHLSSLCAR